MAEFLQQCGSWGVLATLAAYAAGVWINRKTGKALFNPLLMGSIFMIVFLSCFGVPYADYKSSAQPVSWLLMPATVSLAIPLYEKWELLEKNLAAIFASIAAGVLTSLGSVLAMAWLLKLERAHACELFAEIRHDGHRHGCGRDAGRHGGAGRCGHHPDRHRRQPAGRDGLQDLPHHRSAGEGFGARHIGARDRHEQGPADG